MFIYNIFFLSTFDILPVSHLVGKMSARRVAHNSLNAQRELGAVSAGHSVRPERNRHAGFESWSGDGAPLHEKGLEAL